MCHILEGTVRLAAQCPALLLPVPSAIMPHTLNYMFKPLYPGAGLAAIHAEPFNLDQRLIKKL
jgi:hypothetical protein